MPPAERQPGLIHAWHLERVTHPSRQLRRPWFNRIFNSLSDGLTTTTEASVLYALQRLPGPFLLSMSRCIGAAQRFGARTRGLANLKMVLGRESRTPAEWERLWARHILHVGRTAVESIQFGKMSCGQLRELVLVAGEEHLQAALEAGHGAMLFINHLGNLGAIPAALGPRGYDISITGNAMPRPYLEKKVGELFAHGGVKRLLVGDQLPLKAARIFRRNGVLAAFIDYTVVGRLNQWIPFGGAELNTNIGPALLALRNRAPILYASCRRLPFHHHCLCIRPPLACPSTGDRAADALAVTRTAIAGLAVELAERPEEWWPWDCAQVRPLQKRVDTRVRTGGLRPGAIQATPRHAGPEADAASDSTLPLGN